MTVFCECTTSKFGQEHSLAFSRKQCKWSLVAGLWGVGNSGKVSTEPHLVEVAQVILTYLISLENSTAFYVVQWHAKRIGTLGFFAWLHVVTGHLVPYIPLFETLADLFISPHTEVCIHVACKTTTVHLMLLLRVFAIKFR